MEMSKNKKNKNRKRHILWYNPPYCRSVKTNIGKNFLQIVSESFPKSHKLNKILNRNTVKISYCCLPNVGSKILADAMNKYRGPKIDENTPCINHRGNKECPVVGGSCNLRNNVYNAKIITNNKTFNYIGISEPPLRQRIATHAYSFRTNNNQTELSTKIKELKNNNTEYKLEYHLLENTDV